MLSNPTAAILLAMALVISCLDIPPKTTDDKENIAITTDNNGMPIETHTLQTDHDKRHKESSIFPVVTREAEQERLDIDSGNYSGITYISQNRDSTYRFAIVDDKLPDGGLAYLDVPISEDGTADGTKARLTLLNGTTKASTYSDNEGIAFDGKTFWVAAEKNQTICQYDILGNPTGRALDIPEYLGPKHIHKNKGFEALTYQSNAKALWTTTEEPLLDNAGERTHIIQCFALNGSYSCHYVYEGDSPTVSDSLAKAAKAYICGIPAMTMLPDGILLVLERELYVPDMMPDGWCNIRIYATDTRQNPGDTLQKTLLHEFSTGCDGLMPWLANYEGMCLGPVLNGKRTLVLINDSQNGMRDVLGINITFEYIKILLINPDKTSLLP